MRHVLVAGAASLVLANGASGAVGESPSACAVAWNNHHAARLLAVIATNHPRGAFVNARTEVSTMTWTKSGTATSTASRGCHVEFILRNGTTLSVWGPWKDGTVTSWTGPVPSRRRVTVPNNARVRSDGTVGFHG